MVSAPSKVNTHRAGRAAVLVGYRDGNGALSLGVCDDPMLLEQRESDRLGATGLLRTGSGETQKATREVGRRRPARLGRAVTTTPAAER
jgi:streptomycin 6-kinase